MSFAQQKCLRLSAFRAVQILRVLHSLYQDWAAPLLFILGTRYALRSLAEVSLPSPLFNDQPGFGD
jgi:hypothetical protein